MKKLLEYFHPEHFISIPYQIFFVCLTTVILAAMLYKPITQFHPVDSKPGILFVDDATVARWGSQPYRVKTGFSITDFLKFDALKNEFTSNAVIWFEFDEHKVDLKTIEQFSITKGDILKKSDPIIFKKSDGMTVVYYYLRIQFSTILNYARFPLDDHRIYLNLINTSVPPSQLIYDVAQTNFTLSPNLYMSGWAINGHHADSGYARVAVGPELTVEQPKVIFALDISKHDFRQFLLIVLPLLLIFFFGIFSFAIKDITMAITTVLASISALLAYSFVIQAISPAVGYFMLSDYLFLVFLGGIFIIFILNLLEVAPEHLISKRMQWFIKGLSVPLLYLALIIIWYYLTNIKDITF